MKVSLAILALLGKISATELANTNNLVQQEAYPPDDMLLQVDETHKHHHNRKIKQRHTSVVQKKLKDPFYKETKAGKEWFELDDGNERLHGTEEEDNNSPHDPDTVDAPEDMKRVGNDHEALHNAKLSPDGYHDGFYAKDYEGNYSQKGSRDDYVQTDKKDDEMMQIESTNTNQFNHEEDTEDIPQGQDPIGMAQRGSAKQKLSEADAWEGYFKKKSEEALEGIHHDDDEWDKTYAQEEYDKTFEFVQLGDKLSYDHENDTEDIPTNPWYDPIELKKRKRGEPFVSNDELAQQAEDSRMEK